MRPLILPSLATALLVGPLPATAQTSHCAALPATAQVEVRGPDTVIPARLTSRGFQCPQGFTQLTDGTGTRCRQPGPVRLENRQPRRDCYAALNLGPVRGVSGLQRPDATCAGARSLDTIVAIRGRNVGWQDLSLSAPAGSGVTVTHLRASGGRVPAAADPVRQDCFAFDCRLVRLTLRPTTPARVDLTLATPDNASSTTVTLSSNAICPAR